MNPLPCHKFFVLLMMAVMAQIIPRLNEQIKKQTYFPSPNPKRRQSLYRPPRPIPSFHPADYPTSILLAPGNPIISSWNYKRHILPATVPPDTTPPFFDSSQIDNPRPKNFGGGQTHNIPLHCAVVS